MALIPCKNCGQMISDEAKACPRCGHPQKSNNQILLYLAVAAGVVALLAIVAALVIFVGRDEPEEDAPTKEIVVKNDTLVYNVDNPRSEGLAATTVVEGTQAEVRDIISRWDDAHSIERMSELRDLYADKVMFYTKWCTREELIEVKEDALFKRPDFSQRSENLTFEREEDGTVRCDFTKTTFSNGKEGVYHAYLCFQKQNGRWLIVRESDSTTDKNMRKNLQP